MPGFVVSADRLASRIGAGVLRSGGNAVDAAIATNAAMAVVAPHLCGLGGDLFAMVYADGEVACLDAAGHAGSGADAEALRREGRTAMPLHGDIRTVTVPGCVDGWAALHERYGTRRLAELLEPAARLAEEGFRASPLLEASCATLDDAGRLALDAIVSQGPYLRRPGVARVLRALGAGGRAAFYGGEFGSGLLALGAGWFAPSDLERRCARWVTPLRVGAWGVDVWVTPPPSQGYLFAASAVLAAGCGLPDVDDVKWAHLLVECATAVGHDRPDLLWEGADGASLLERAVLLQGLVNPDRASTRGAPASAGDTTYLAVLDGSGMGVSLIQSNASGFGSRIVEPATGINLHNRGLGFNLIPGHPAELRPGGRPPHTLVASLLTDEAGLRALLGTMGGDAQPQILLQLAARLCQSGQTPGAAVEAPRWVLRGSTGFDTWNGTHEVAVEDTAPWAEELAHFGHRVRPVPAGDSSFGHAHVIARTEDGWAAAADPRTLVGAVAGKWHDTQK